MENEKDNSGRHSDGWRAQLPDDLKENDSLTRFEKIGDLGREYIALKGKLDNSIQLLTEDATDEERAEFFNRLGRPETADDYSIERPELLEDLPYNEALEREFREEAHRLGLSDEQARGLFEWYHNNMASAHGEFSAIRERNHRDAVETMKRYWGSKFDENIEVSKRAVNEYGGDELKQLLDESGLGDHPAMIQAFFKIGRAIMNDRFVEGTPSKEPKVNILDKIYPNMEE